MSYHHPKDIILYKLKSEHDEVGLETTQKNCLVGIQADAVVHVCDSLSVLFYSSCRAINFVQQKAAANCHILFSSLS
jgi:hypothetical protein